MITDKSSQGFWSRLGSGIGQVILLHRVCEDTGHPLNRYLQVTPQYLEKVLRYYISHDIDIVSLDECYERIISKKRAKRFVAFTLDDGYADNLTHALPVFEKYNAPFTLFLATGYPDHKIILWWYIIEDLILKNDSLLFNYDGTEYNMVMGTKNEKEEAFWKIRRFIIESDRESLVPRLKAVCNDRVTDLYAFTKELALTWEQVSVLSSHPLVTIGAHTVNHLALSKLTDNEVITEISDSVSIIRDKTGEEISYLAYPMGSKSEAGMREEGVAGRCGIKLAFMAISGNIYRHHSEALFSLPRISLDESTRVSWRDPYFNSLIVGAKRTVRRIMSVRKL